MSITQRQTTGELLRRYRRVAGLTQQELAERAAVSARSISDIERGSSLAPHRGTLDGLADALGLSSAERALFLASARAGRSLGGGDVVPARDSDVVTEQSERGTFALVAPRSLRRAASQAHRTPVSIRFLLVLGLIALAAAVAFTLTKGTSQPLSVAAVRVFVPWQIQQEMPARLGFATGVTIGPGGTVYVNTVSPNPRIGGVWKLAPSGRVLAHWDRYGETTISGSDTTVDQQGTVFVLDRSHDHVLRLSSGGTVVAVWGAYGSSPGHFIQAQAIAVDRHDHVYVGDALGRIQKFSATGKLIAVWANCGVHQQTYCHPTHMKTDPHDNLFVADLATGTVRKLSPSGAVLRIWGFPAVAPSPVHPTAIDFDRRGDIFVGDANNGTINQLSPTGTPLTWWGGTPHGLPGVDGLGFDRQSNLFVSNSQDGHIQKFSARGVPYTGWTPFWAEQVSFNSLSGMALDPRGNILVVTSDPAATLLRISPAGHVLSAWPASVLGAGQAHAPTDVTVDAAGHVYVVDAISNRVVKLSGSGTVLQSFGHEGSGPGQLESPAAVAVDRQGNLYVSDVGNRRVVKFSPGGQPLAQWATAPDGTALFLQPQGIALDAHGTVYVADREKHAIEKLSSDGTLLAQWGGWASKLLSEPVGVAVDTRGLVYVTDAGDSRVKALSADGDMVAEWGRNGARPGEFSQPSALTVDRDGAVYVADSGNNRIQKLTTR